MNDTVGSRITNKLGNGEKTLMWSCRVIDSLSTVISSPLGILSDYYRCCHYCGDSFEETAWTELLNHVIHRHNWRECAQEWYSSIDDFLDHIAKDHRVVFVEDSRFDGTISYKACLLIGSNNLSAA